jgi:leucyl aminopeptidase
VEIRALTGGLDQIHSKAAIITLFDDKTPPAEGQEVFSQMDEALGGLLKSLIDSGEIKGKTNEVTLVHTQGKVAPLRLLIVGLGKREDFSARVVRQAAGTAARYLRKKGCKRITTLLHGSGQGISQTESARAIVEGTLLGLYQGDLHKTSERDPVDLEELTLVHPSPEISAHLAPALELGRITAEAVNLARDLGNEPPNIINPSAFAQRAADLAASINLPITILEEDDLRRLNMGGLLAVAAGSANPGGLIALRYAPVEETRLLAFVGKGITFDSGGLSLKNRDQMDMMKNDMAGAAAVLGAIWAIARLKLPINVLGVIPLAENLLDGKAYRPGDVLTTMAGKTIEVISTDAEGRLILADALAYAVKENATHIIDIATLTGSCAVALGGQASGVFSNDDNFADTLAEIGETAGERLWRLPIYPEYRESMESKVADMKNFGSRYGDASNAASMLQEFVGDKPWAHLDIAATDWNEKVKPYLADGPTGVATATLIRLAEKMSRPGTGA